MKIAPEHSVAHVLIKMGKPNKETLIKFKNIFYRFTKIAKKKQFLTYYMIAAHPGCSAKDMEKLKAFVLQELKLLPQQIQVFTPTPSTYSTLMYWTEKDPFTGESCFVEKTYRGRENQKKIVTNEKMYKLQKTIRAKQQK